MLRFGRLRVRESLMTLAAGAVIGTVVLGIGGRAAMRLIALAQNTAPGFSVGGSMTVVFLGLVSGVAVAAIFLAVRFLFPDRVLLREFLFWTACIAITLRGLSGLLSVLTASLFITLVLLTGVLLHFFWKTIQWR